MQRNKVALITGGAKRIGKVITKHFHDNNYNVIIHYRSDSTKILAEELVTSLNSIRTNSAVCIQAELEKMSDKKFITDFTKMLLKSFNRLDVLVNNASTFFATPMGNADLNDWRDLMISNAGGPFFLSQGVAPYLQQSNGSIVNISDIHAVRPLKQYPIYSIAKAANNMMTKALARELAPHIRVNAVSPGPSLWPDNSNKHDYVEINQRMINKTVLKRLSNPIDIARSVLFLAENTSITGQILAVDCGRSIKL